MDQANPQFNQFKPAKKKSRKKVYLIILLTLIVIVGATFVSWLWYNQAQEHKEKMVLRDQEISELQKRIDELEEKDITDTSKVKALELQEWNVEIPLEQTTEFIATDFKADPSADNPGGGYYYIVTRGLVPGCSGDAAVGAIARYSANHRIADPGMLGEEVRGKTWKEGLSAIYKGEEKTIGDYVFTFTIPQSGCFAGDPLTTEGRAAGSVQEQTTKEFQELFKGLRAAP